MDELFYSDSYIKEFNSKITKIIGNEVYMDRTAFYPEGGGQPSDQGEIEGEDFKLYIESVKRKGNEIVHIFKVIYGKPKIGKVKCKINWERRYDFMQQHTGHHIIASAIKKILGVDVFGSIIKDDLNKIEFEYDENPTKKIIEIEKLANKIVWSSLPIETKFCTNNEIKKMKLRKSPKKDLKKIRIVKIGNFDLVPCGGTHVNNSSEVGVIKIISLYRKTKNIWRIEFQCGFRALKYINKIINDYNLSIKLINADYGKLAEYLKKLLEENINMKKDYENIKMENIINKMENNNGVCYYMGSMEINFMNKLAFELREKCKKCKIVILSSYNGYILILKERASKLI